MSALDEACKAVTEEIDGAAACGVIDLDTGMILGSFSSAEFSQELNELVAIATVELFRGPTITRIEQGVRSHYGLQENGARYVQEFYVAAGQTSHFARTIREGQAVLLLITERSTNIGMGWAKLRSASPAIEQLVP